ncbi:MAG: ribosomal protein S18-alanine N-acetyltransferase [Clostridiales bacterium]|nr:ribosomal protein S18-alanine N-acetyltransferase [Clostridiales bacterium]
MAESIRFAQAGDVQQIMALEQGSIAHPWPEEDVRRLITDDEKFALVLEAEDQTITGYIGVSVVVGEASVGNLVVAADQRGKGFGTKLVEALIEELMSRGAEVIFLEVEDTNTPAVSVYTGRGFEEYNRRRDYYGAGRDAILMKRALAGV